MTAFEKLFGLIRKNEKRTGSDYTATVTRVKDGIAYVQITGAEITDTPVAMSVDAKAGDRVRVRVNGGKAWLTGNDTRPPNNNTDEIEAVEKASDEHGKKLKELEDLTANSMPAVGKNISDKFTFLNTMTVVSKKVTKYGKRVFFNIEFYVSPVPTGARFDVGSCDASINPSSNEYFSGIVTNSSYVPQGNAILIITNQGALRVASSTANGGYIFFSGSYEIA